MAEKDEGATRAQQEELAELLVPSPRPTRRTAQPAGKPTLRDSERVQETITKLQGITRRLCRTPATTAEVEKRKKLLLRQQEEMLRELDGSGEGEGEGRAGN